MKRLSIDDLKLSTRARNALNHMNICDIEQLLNTPMKQIAEQRNVGVKTLTEIKEALYKFILDNIGEDEANKFISDAGKNDIFKRNFSKEEIEELSRYSIYDLNFSYRILGLLRGIGCRDLGALAQMTPTDIKNVKGLGKKTYDIINNTLGQWLKDNMLISAENDNDVISEKECHFFHQLNEKIKPIYPIYWKRLRNIVLCADNIKIEDWNLEVVNEEHIRQVLTLPVFRNSLIDFFLQLAPNGIIEKDEFDKRLATADLEFDISVLMDIFFDNMICITVDEYYILNRPQVMQYLQERYVCDRERDKEIFLERLSGDTLQKISKKHGLTKERVRQITIKAARRVRFAYEDYFCEPYQYFKLSKKEFCKMFPSCGETGYGYLSLKYRQGEVCVTTENVQDYSGLFSKRIRAVWNEE